MISQYKMEIILLGFRRLRKIHSGENIAEAVFKVIRKYGFIGNQIGWFVFNNVTSNDICVEEILKALNINDIVKRRRLRYLDYIINLTIKAFFFGSDSNTFEKEIKRT